MIGYDFILGGTLWTKLEKQLYMVAFSLEQHSMFCL